MRKRIKVQLNQLNYFYAYLISVIYLDIFLPVLSALLICIKGRKFCTQAINKDVYLSQLPDYLNSEVKQSDLK